MIEPKTDAWMPLWIGSYLADTMRLTTVQHGAYLLLLMAYWRERCPLPDDDEELRSITKMEKSDWKKVRPVIAKFFKVDDGVWWHKRVEKEMKDADARSKQASGKAQAAAQARWGDKPKHAASKAPGNASSMLQALPEDVLDECPTPTPIYTVPKGTAADAAKLPSDLTKEELWSAGKSILAQQGLPPAQCGSFIGKLVKDYGGDVVVEAVRAAVVERPANAQEFLVGACRSRGKKPSYAGSLNLLPPDSPRIREIRADNPDEWPDWMRDDVEVAHAG